MKTCFALVVSIASALFTIPAIADVRYDVEKYKGRNSAAWIYKECGLEIYRSDGQITLLRAYNSSAIYDIWMNPEERRGVDEFETPFSGHIGFSSRDKRSNKFIYSNRSYSNEDGSRSYSLSIELNDSKELKLGFSLDHFTLAKNLTSIRCRFND